MASHPPMGPPHVSNPTAPLILPSGPLVGTSSDGNAGVTGQNLLMKLPAGVGVDGFSEVGTGVNGRSNGVDAVGVSGFSQRGTGVRGASSSASGAGVYGENDGSGAGVHGLTINGPAGVLGEGTDSPGVLGKSVQSMGISGQSTKGPGVYGTSGGGDETGPGVSGHNSSGIGVYGKGIVGVQGDSFGSLGLAGSFNGDVQVKGNTSLSGNVSISGRLTGSFLGITTSGPVTAATITSEGAIAGTTISASGTIIASSGVDVASGDIVVRGGNVQMQGGDIFLTNADCAEDFSVSSVVDATPGTVMVIHDEKTLKPSSAAYDRRVAGVVSGAGGFRPGITLDRQKEGQNRLPVALLGKVYCKVDAHFAPIDVGDLLTTSPTTGHAMRADDRSRAFGAVLGKALGKMEQGTGLIPILVTLQ